MRNKTKYDRTCNVCSSSFKTTTRTATHCSRKCVYRDPDFRQKMRISKLKDKNPMWKGDNISYGGIHSWVNRHVAKPSKCQCCNEEKRLDAANISQEYKRDPADWEWLCRRCHMIKDGRLYVFNLNRRASDRDGKGRFIKVDLEG